MFRYFTQGRWWIPNGAALLGSLILGIVVGALDLSVGALYGGMLAIALVWMGLIALVDPDVDRPN